MAERLANDVFIFSGLKTHAQLFEAYGMLTDENGKVKTFEKFQKDIKTLNDTYNGSYLESEYQFAKASSQQAGKWAKIEQTGDRYNLQYRTAQDDRVRPAHQLMANITLPPTDQFWNSYYPPNGWRCRCVAVQVRKKDYETSDSETANKAGDKATTQIGKDGKNKLAIFRFNPGKEGVVFPPGHPYRKVVGAKKAIKAIKK